MTTNVGDVRTAIYNGAEALERTPMSEVVQDIRGVPLARATLAAGELGDHLRGIENGIDGAGGALVLVGMDVSSAGRIWGDALQGSGNLTAGELLAAAEDLATGREGVSTVVDTGAAMRDKLEEVKGLYQRLSEGLGALAVLQAQWVSTAENLQQNVAQTAASARQLGDSWNG